MKHMQKNIEQSLGKMCKRLPIDHPNPSQPLLTSPSVNEIGLLDFPRQSSAHNKERAKEENATPPKIGTPSRRKKIENTLSSDYARFRRRRHRRRRRLKVVLILLKSNKLFRTTAFRQAFGLSPSRDPVHSNS